MGDIVVFTGSAHHELAEEICSDLGVELAPTNITRFSNDCLQVQLRENCRQRDVYIVQPLVPPVQDHLVELLLMLDAARGASAAQITAVIPHYAYARSDKKDAPRISIGGPPGGRPDRDRGRRPGAHDGAARAAGARLLLGAGRPPVGHRRARDALQADRPVEHGRRLARTWATPRRRPGSPGCSASRSRPAASSGWPTTRW